MRKKVARNYAVVSSILFGGAEGLPGRPNGSKYWIDFCLWSTQHVQSLAPCRQVVVLRGQECEPHCFVVVSFRLLVRLMNNYPFYNVQLLCMC
jgi:hypothetical protein